MKGGVRSVRVVAGLIVAKFAEYIKPFEVHK